MTPTPRERRLTSLVHGVGLDYLRRLMPPVWLALAMLATAATWMALSRHDLVALAALAIALGGALVYWPKRGQQPWPLWRTLALGLAASLEAVPGGAYHDVFSAILVTVAAVSALHALARLVASIRLSWRLHRSARALDEASLLAVLPDEAREDAQRWCSGDDSKSAELSLVVNLAALWAAMSAVGAADLRRRPTAM